MKGIKAQVTKRKTDVLVFIREYIENHKYPPTIREIGEKCGIPSTSLTVWYVEKLQEDGFLTRDAKISRGIALIKQEERT